MVCEKCGKIIPDDSSFCNFCGNILNDFEETGRLDDIELNPTFNSEVEQTNTTRDTLYNNVQSQAVDGGIAHNPNIYNCYNTQAPVSNNEYEQTNPNICNYDSTQTPAPGNGYEQVNTNTYNYNNMQTPVSNNVYEPTNTNPFGYGNAQSNEYIDFANMSVMDYNAFYERFASKKLKSWTKTFYIICFITAAVSLVPIFFGNFLSILDIAFYGVMGFLILKKKYWIFTLAVTLFSGIFSIIGLVTTGTITGIFALVAGIFATKGLKKLQDAYDSYKRTGRVPENEIN